MIVFFAIIYIVLVVGGALVYATTETYLTTNRWCYPCCIKDEVKTREGILSVKHWMTLRLPWALCIRKGRLGGKHYDIHRIGKCPYSIYKRQTYGIYNRGVK